jgi:phosphoribosylanthranilate isomerase
MLIGELLMRSPQRTRLTASLMGEFEQGKAAAPSFFTKLMQRYSGRPLVKLCGITREEDAEAAVENGADVLGFILAPSRRQIEIGELKRFSRYPVLKVAVVADADAPTLAGLDRLLESGVIDGVQFHGHESRELVRGYRGNAYKALIPRTPADIAEDPFAPFTLYDRPKNQENDSLGTPFGRETAAALQGTWIAGGITPDNLEEVVRRFSPILVDIASGVEKSPGIKDHDKIRAVRAILRRLYG